MGRSVSLLDELDLSSIADERIRQGLLLLLNLVEELKRENADLRAENQRLRDEINRLKGEHGKPTIKGNTPKTPPGPAGNYSSEKERRKPQEWSKGPKSALVRVDREQTLQVDRTTLPEDAQFKGHEDVVVQDVVLSTDNVLFHKEKFYSPRVGQSYLAPLPSGYEGQFGPGIKALTIVLAFGANVSEPKILELYRNVGVVISAGQVSNFLIKEQEVFHTAKRRCIRPGWRAAPGSTWMRRAPGSTGRTSSVRSPVIRSTRAITPPTPKTARQFSMCCATAGPGRTYLTPKRTVC